MSAWKVRQESILTIVGEDGPIMREMRKPQIMHVKVQNYGLKKLMKRHGKRSKVKR